MLSGNDPGLGYDRSRALRLNRAIDEALLDPGRHGAMTLYSIAGDRAPATLAERVWRRASRLAARVRDIAQRRDELIAAVYVAAAPCGWFNAWCDASSSRSPPGRSGLGGLVMDGKGRIVKRVARVVPERDPFTAEVAALAEVLQAALDAGATQLRVHTDCAALAQLWYKQRTDPRLDAVRALARRLRGFGILPIPRAHNQPANKLARAAMTSTSKGTSHWCDAAGVTA